MIIDSSAIGLVVDALKKCAETATDESGLKIVFDVTDADARRAVMSALVSLSPYQVPIFQSGFHFCASGVVFPPERKRVAPWAAQELSAE